MKYYISNLQITTMAANYIIAATLLSVPQAFIDYGMQNSWIIPIILFIFSFLFVQVFLFGFNKLKYPEKLWESNTILPKIIAFLMFLFMAHILIRDLRIISSFTKSVLIPMTPQFITTMVFALTIIYLAWAGIEVIARFTELYFLYFIIVVLFIPLSLINQFEFAKFEPLLNLKSIPSVIQSSFVGLAWVGEIIVFILIVTMIKPIKHVKRSIIIGSGIGMFLLTLLLLGQVGVVGAHLTRFSMYPTYLLIQQIRLTEFLDRLDLVIVSFYYPTIFAKMAFTLYGAQRCIEIMLNKDTKIVIIPIGITMAILSIVLFKNSIENFDFEVLIWPSLGLTLEILIGSLFAVLILKTIKNSKSSTSSS